MSTLTCRCHGPPQLDDKPSVPSWPGGSGNSSGYLVNILDFNFKAAEHLGQQVVNRSENHEKDETEYPGKYRPQKVNKSDDSELVVAEDDHRNADERVDEAHQDIKGGHYLAGL